jgi:hypothetical protein
MLHSVTINSEMLHILLLLSLEHRLPYNRSIALLKYRLSWIPSNSYLKRCVHVLRSEQPLRRARPYNNSLTNESLSRSGFDILPVHLIAHASEGSRQGIVRLVQTMLLLYVSVACVHDSTGPVLGIRLRWFSWLHLKTLDCTAVVKESGCEMGCSRCSSDASCSNIFQ